MSKTLEELKAAALKCTRCGQCLTICPVYGKTFEEEKTSLFFYILCADRQALEDCDRQILSKSRIS